MAEALFDFRKATLLRPNYEPHLYDYALTLLRMNQFAEAEEAARAAVRAAPQKPEGYELLGELLGQQRKFAEAADQYKRVLELQPDSARTQLELARRTSRTRKPV